MKSEKYKEDLAKLISEGNKLLFSLQWEHLSQEEKETLKKQIEQDFGKEKLDKNLIPFSEKYQGWYSESLELIKQVLPARIDDFINYYKPRTQRSEINESTYTISDCLEGLSFTRSDGKIGPKDAIPKFEQQLNILKSLQRKFDSSLFEVRELLQYELFDDELEAAWELSSKGFLRGAGAVAGVVLEGHLSEVCKRHNIQLTKDNPSVGDYNQKLKNSDVVETKDWRKIQHLADIRNLCDHKKEKEPRKEDVKELITGVENIIERIK